MGVGVLTPPKGWVLIRPPPHTWDLEYYGIQLTAVQLTSGWYTSYWNACLFRHIWWIQIIHEGVLQSTMVKCFLVSTYVVCERLSVIHYTFQLPEFLVQNSLSAPTQVFQECWSEPPPPCPPPLWSCRFGQILALWVELVWTPPHADLDRSLHFGLSWAGPPSTPQMQIWTDPWVPPLKYFRNVGLTTPHPPKDADFNRSWHFGLSWSGKPPPPNADFNRSWHFGLSCSGHPPPPPMQIWTDLGTLG